MMASENNPTLCDLIVKEFETWQESHASETIFLLETNKRDDESAVMSMLLACEHEFKLIIPKGYPDYEDNFFVEADPVVKLWSTSLNEFLLDSQGRLSLSEVLNKAVGLYSKKQDKSRSTSSEEEFSNEEEEEEEDKMEDEEDEDEEEMILADDDAFTTEWDLKVARKKKRWAQKEAQIREQMKKAKLSTGTGAATASTSSMDPKPTNQIFTSPAAAGILTNDLVKIMEVEQDVGFTAEPIDDNIYHWKVKIFNFDSSSEVSKDLAEIEKNFGYNYIELEMMFEIDLYPFYPPLVKVMRPRLQGSMMQRVTNMEILKLSYWAPTKDMKSVILEIKSFLQHWARLEVESERNDLKRYPHGAYLEMEHHLLTLALVSEVSPRVNLKYQLVTDNIAELRPLSSNAVLKGGKQDKEYWARGVGYGHHNRPEWDINAYIAAQKEKDNKIIDVLHKILDELKILYANHAPQLKPRVQAHSSSGPDVTDTGQTDSVDPVYDMFTVLEGSALIPFMEQYLRADSFLEICRHSEVYKAIVDIIKEIARQKALLPLLCALANQSMSIYQLLEQLEKKASLLLKHLCKAGNGSVPHTQSATTQEPDCSGDSSFPFFQKCFRGCRGSSSSQSPGMTDSDVAEERLAREFVFLFKIVSESLELRMLQRNNSSSGSSELSSNNGDQTSIVDVQIDTIPQVDVLEVQYKQVLQSMQFYSCDFSLEGSTAHNYATQFKACQSSGQTQIFRIAQELSSLSSSLPLDLSSSIFVRSDDERLTLMKALITGPEGTPYSGGCFTFDIFFPPSYPKVPPQVNLQTTGQGKVRFNPNLYACGKVCLSLLGTWEGQKGEQWNEKTSTVLQVLVSIQSLILVPDPYFNEPGFEQEIGTETGRKHSDEYNSDVCYNNIKYAMLSQLQSPPPEFADVIKAHFYLKKQKILEEVEGWVNKSSNRRLDRLAQNLKQEFKKLQAPQILNGPS